MRDFYEKNEGAPAVVGAALRSVLEGYGRVAFQPYFPSGAMLGGFIEKERKRQAAGTSRLRVDLDELEELDALRDDSNEFKHFNDASAADVNVGELRGLEKRVLTFVGYRPKEPA